MAFMSGLHAKPFAQFGHRAVEPPPGTREEWQIFTDLCLAMGKPLFGYRGVNTFVKLTRKLAKLTGRPAIAFGPRWIDRLVVATGRRVRWRDLMSHPHGLLLGEPEFGQFRAALKTPDKKVHAAPPEFLARTRELLAQPHPVAPARYPFQLANRRHRHSMNSWLNELPGLHPGGKTSEVIVNPSDAATLGILDGELVRVSSPVGEVELAAKVSDQPRVGVVIIDHGWGSRIFDPRDRKQPESYGVNRNLLVDTAEIDPLSQTAPMNSSYVRIDRVAV
jgi:formate dehydrogenase